jgi:hypothetical protein
MFVSDSWNEHGLSSETIKWEHARVIVWGDYASNVLNGHHVLIWTAILVIMEASWAGDRAI